MAQLANMSSTCGTPNPPGTKSKLRLTVKGELTGWPQTVAALKEAANDPADPVLQGDTKRFGENFDFSNASSGRGFWREFDILVDTGNLQFELEGEVGGQGYKSMIPFTIIGTEAEKLEFADTVAAYSGCLVASITGRNNVSYIVGNPDIPAVVDTATGASGTKNGERNATDFVVRASTGYTPMTIDAAAFPFKTTPNP